MSQRQRCQREVLVESSLAKIELCTCGMIHLTTGALTVRLERQAFDALSATINEAHDRLQLRKSSCKAVAPS